MQPSTGHAGEYRLLADVSSLQQGHRWCTVLAGAETVIWGAEHLLAALECCGVHNARIEVEGGKGMLLYGFDRVDPLCLGCGSLGPNRVIVLPALLSAQSCPSLMVLRLAGLVRCCALECKSHVTQQALKWACLHALTRCKKCATGPSLPFAAAKRVLAALELPFLESNALIAF